MLSVHSLKIAFHYIKTQNTKKSLPNTFNNTSALLLLTVSSLNSLIGLCLVFSSFERSHLLTYLGITSSDITLVFLSKAIKHLQLPFFFFLNVWCFNASLHFILDAHFPPVNITVTFVTVTGDKVAVPSLCKGYFSVIIQEIHRNTSKNRFKILKCKWNSQWWKTAALTLAYA